MPKAENETYTIDLPYGCRIIVQNLPRRANLQNALIDAVKQVGNEQREGVRRLLNGR